MASGLQNTGQHPVGLLANALKWWIVNYRIRRRGDPSGSAYHWLMGQQANVRLVMGLCHISYKNSVLLCMMVLEVVVW